MADGSGPQGRLQTATLNFTATGTYNSPSMYVTPRVGGLSLGATVRAIAGASPSVVVRLQQSADPDAVDDATAFWTDLATFTAIVANGQQFQPVTGPHQHRLRWQIVRSGTFTNADVTCSLQ